MILKKYKWELLNYKSDIYNYVVNDLKLVKSVTKRRQDLIWVDLLLKDLIEKNNKYFISGFYKSRLINQNEYKNYFYNYYIIDIKK